MHFEYQHSTPFGLARNFEGWILTLFSISFLPLRIQVSVLVKAKVLLIEASIACDSIWAVSLQKLLKHFPELTELPCTLGKHGVYYTVLRLMRWICLRRGDLQKASKPACTQDSLCDKAESLERYIWTSTSSDEILTLLQMWGSKRRTVGSRSLHPSVSWRMLLICLLWILTLLTFFQIFKINKPYLIYLRKVYACQSFILSWLFTFVNVNMKAMKE